MYIEDLIISLIHNRVPVNAWDKGVVISFYTQINDLSGFTEKQSALAVRICKRYASSLSLHAKQDIALLLENPKFRNSIRKSVNSRSVKIVDDEYLHRVIEVNFPYDEKMIAEIREFKNQNHDNLIVWNKEKSSWQFCLTEPNIKFLSDHFKNTGADIDMEFQNYSDQIDTIVTDLQSHIPMLSAKNGSPTIVNAPKTMPEINTDNILAAAFIARQYGITMWDETIDDFISSDQVDVTTREFLKSDYLDTTKLSADVNGICCLANIARFMGPMLFVIPGGSEYRKIQQIYTVLSDIGITNKKMSVLFRLSSETGKEFNNFVKNHELNNPISEETQIVFVSGKLPKPLIESEIRFNSIVNVGFNNAHYTLKEYAKNHQNVVYFELEKQKGSDFGHM
jgi:preprotein translocase subunit SecD